MSSVLFSSSVLVVVILASLSLFVFSHRSLARHSVLSRRRICFVFFSPLCFAFVLVCVVEFSLALSSEFVSLSAFVCLALVAPVRILSPASYCCGCDIVGVR